VKVVVTFLDEPQRDEFQRIDLAQFSFAQSRAILRELKSSLSDVLVAERRNAA
jgi:hypothetical protein